MLRLLPNQLGFTEEIKSMMANAGGTYPERYLEPKKGEKGCVIYLLPANGSVKGLRARGGFEVNITEPSGGRR
jgi:hypothetical protein